MRLKFTHEDHLREDDSGKNDVAVVMFSDYNKLSQQLSAERARRMKAEEVVDLGEEYLGTGDEYTLFAKSIKEYRAQYPRVEKDHD